MKLLKLTFLVFCLIIVDCFESSAQNEAVEEVEIDAPPPLPPPPPPPPRSNKAGVQEIFKVVEDMPEFPGCEETSDKQERSKCSQEKMIDFIYNNLEYPKIAGDNGVEGMVVIQFVVQKDGVLDNIKIVRDIGAGCGAEAERIVRKMPKWNPGKQRGRPVNVQFNLPVRFKMPDKK